jgi:hypothetical protein
MIRIELTQLELLAAATFAASASSASAAHAQSALGALGSCGANDAASVVGLYAGLYDGLLSPPPPPPLPVASDVDGSVGEYAGDLHTTRRRGSHSDHGFGRSGVVCGCARYPTLRRTVICSLRMALE